MTDDPEKNDDKTEKQDIDPIILDGIKKWVLEQNAQIRNTPIGGGGKLLTKEELDKEARQEYGRRQIRKEASLAAEAARAKDKPHESAEIRYAQFETNARRELEKKYLTKQSALRAMQTLQRGEIEKRTEDFTQKKVAEEQNLKNLQTRLAKRTTASRLVNKIRGVDLQDDIERAEKNIGQFDEGLQQDRQRLRAMEDARISLQQDHERTMEKFERRIEQGRANGYRIPPDLEQEHGQGQGQKP